MVCSVNRFMIVGESSHIIVYHQDRMKVQFSNSKHVIWLWNIGGMKPGRYSQKLCSSAVTCRQFYIDRLYPVIVNCLWI